MLVECSNCGAPLSLQGEQRFVKCVYCDFTNKVRSLKTIAMQTPAHWKPPERWTPPVAASAPSARVLVYHGPPPATVPQVQPRKSVGCVLLVALLVTVLGAIAPILLTMPGGVSSVLSSITGIDVAASPAQGVVSMDPGQPPAERTGTISGSIQASSVASGCHGYVGTAANLVIRLSQPRLVRVVARSSADTTLLVREPTGTIRCDDDSAGSRNPMVSAVLPAGDTRVWVGTFGRSTVAVFNLTIDAFEGGSAAAADPLGAGVQAAANAVALAVSAPPELGTLDLDGQSSGIVRGVVHSLVDVQPLGVGCHGLTSAAPHMLIRTSGPRHVRITTSGDGDLTLVVRGPDNAFRCDDDSGGRRQPLLEGVIAAGTHLVWVGVYDRTQPTSFELRVEPVLAAPSPRRTRRAR